MEDIPAVKCKKTYKVGLVLGNLLEYYDHSLYGYLAPTLASHFFPSQDPVISVIIAYLLIPIGFISRPLGGYWIGKIGDKLDRRKALAISILGMGAVTFLIGCLPVYQKIGLLAPILLVLCRLLQAFFVGAEFNGGAITLLENTDNHLQGFMSGLYSATTVAGILLASMMAWVVSLYPSLSWRFPFYLSFFTAMIAFYIRIIMVAPLQSPSKKLSKNIPFKVFIKIYKLPVFTVTGAAGLFSTLYLIPSIFLNTYVPIISNLSPERIVFLNNIALLVYMLSLFFFGLLSIRFSVLSIMRVGAILTVTFSYPLFCLLVDTNLKKVLIVKICFSIIAGAFNSRATA